MVLVGWDIRGMNTSRMCSGARLSLLGPYLSQEGRRCVGLEVLSLYHKGAAASLCTLFLYKVLTTQLSD